MTAQIEGRRAHWEGVYRAKAVDSVSWYQPHATRAVVAVEALGLARDAAILDVGGGASTFVDDMLALGYAGVTVLDLSQAALDVAQARLGEQAARARWVAADITRFDPAPSSVDVWHDRAVFHFLTTESERAAYREAMLQALRPGGYAIIATFAEDGPQRCSGLPVVRYTAQQLVRALGPALQPLWDARERHQTPSGATQSFLYVCARRVSSG